MDIQKRNSNAKNLYTVVQERIKFNLGLPKESFFKLKSTQNNPLKLYTK